MRIVGIDPSLTGTAVCVWPNDPLVYSSKPADGVYERIRRYRDLTARVTEKIRLDDLILIEGYSFGSKGNAGRWLAEYGAILRDELIKYSPGVIEVPPSLLKKFATGKGIGAKTIVSAHVGKRWGRIFDTDDETDAFVLAQIGLCYAGQVEPDNQAQREVIETLKSGGVKKKLRAKKTEATS